MSDYTLFLFAGFTHKHLRNLQHAAKYYREAIELQGDQLPAWQGLFEVLTDGEWEGGVDEFAIKVVDKLISE